MNEARGDVLAHEVAADVTALAALLAQASSPWVTPRAAVTRVTQRVERLNRADQLRHHLELFLQQPGCLGWMETPQAVTLVRHGQALPLGTPLAADLCCGCESLAVRHVDGEWIVTLTREAIDGEIEAVTVEVERVSAIAGVHCWVHRVFHVAKTDGSLEPVAERLSAVRFAENDKGA